MKRLLALLIPVCVMGMTLFGCGSDTDTAKPGANGSIIEPEDNMTTGEDMLEDGKDAVDDMVDEGKDMMDDMTDNNSTTTTPDAAPNQNNSAGTANTTVETPNR